MARHETKRAQKPRWEQTGGTRGNIEGLIRARKAHDCAHRNGFEDKIAAPCAGPIQPGDLYFRVRSGSWLDYVPVHIDCLTAAGHVRVIPPASGSTEEVERG